jgi:hypothetical protein
MGFRIAHGKMITWASTAAIVLELYNYPSSDAVDLEHFLTRILGLNLVHEKTGLLMTRKEVEEHIAHCRTLSYMVHEEPHGLHALPRVDEERLFLEWIAEHAESIPKRQIRTQRPRKRIDREQESPDTSSEQASNKS